MVDFRFPVQYVIRPHQDFRGFAGRIASGTIQPGEEVVVLPSGQRSRVREVLTTDGPLVEAAAGDAITLALEDDVDVSRGDMIVRKLNLPSIGSRFEAILCWMTETGLDPDVPYVLLHTTRQVRSYVGRVVYRIDVDTLHREEAGTFGLNDIGRVEITTAQPLFYDPYRVNHATGSFVLVDPFTNATVAAGMIRGAVQTAEEVFGEDRDEERKTSPNVVWEGWNVPREEREARNGHKAAVLWFTGLSGARKSTIARALERRLFERGCQTMLLDGDQVRHGLCGDLGFGPEDRKENIRRVGEAAKLFFEQGNIVLCAFVSPFREDRERVRTLFPEGRFFEIHVDCDLEELKRRDPKGLYERVEKGEITNLTGVDAPYEAPEAPALSIPTERVEVDQAVDRLDHLLQSVHVISA